MKHYLYCGDAYDLLGGIINKIPRDKKIALITDPPYLFNNSGGGKFRSERKGGNTIVKKKMDKGFDPSILFHERISSVVCFMHNDQVFDLGVKLKQHYARAVIRGWLKKNPSPMENKNYQADTELFIHAWQKDGFPVGKGKKRFSVHGRDKERTGHPAQKPVSLMRDIVRVVNADVIIDPFAGSGSTGVACKLEGKNFIGIEMDPDYFKMMEQRMEKEE